MSSLPGKVVADGMFGDIDVNSPSSFETDERPVRMWEFLALVGMVLLADLTLYWGQGYSGVGLFLLLAPSLLRIGRPDLVWNRRVWGWVAVLVLIVLRLAWLGTPLRAFCGIVLLTGLAVTILAGTVTVRTLWMLPIQSLPAGVLSSAQYFGWLRKQSRRVPNSVALSVVLPVAAVMTFGTLFILANPDVVNFVTSQLGKVVTAMLEWLRNIDQRPAEIAFCAMVAVLFAGILRPMIDLQESSNERQQPAEVVVTSQSTFYPAFRNTLFSLVLLFGCYLVFEFRTLWFRTFPIGFYYAGYAHQGAFWLTVALALATGSLSLIFRGEILADPRLPMLRRLAWIWCALNGLLAISVYNRMFIYIGFNGLTHMRIVGLFGITALVAGFLLVVWKILKRRGFLWLVNRQIVALAIIILLYAVSPVDLLAVSYNASRVLRGDSTAVMQIGVQELDTEALLALPQLLESGDKEIREGVRALLAEHAVRLNVRREARRHLGWTSWQFAEDYVLNRLESLKSKWAQYEDSTVREKALKRFYEYAYQWY